MPEIYWGIDMGGTKIEGAVFQTDPELRILSRIRVDTEQQHGYEHILGQFAKLVNQLRDSTGLKPDIIGVGTPGAIDLHTRKVKNSNTQCIIGKPMNADLEKILGTDIVMGNDANCFAFAETILGAVPDHVKNPEVVFGIIMGTGVGGGIVVHNRLINGLHGIAGEWGHNPLADDGDLCYCGHKACVETFISGPATEKYYYVLTGEKIKATEVYERSLANDQAAKQTIDRLVSYFGKAVARIINILDPEVIVIGGGLSRIDRLYTEGRDEIIKHLFNKDLDTKLVRPKLGDSAGVIGAGLLRKH